MTFAQLRTFVAVAEAGSIAGAAESMCVSQPAVSASVASLAHELGVALLERRGRSLALTPAGERFAAYARRVLGLAEEATEAARAEAGATSLLRIAAVTTAAERFVPGMIAAFRPGHPGIGVALEVAPRDRVWRLLADHVVDLAVAGRPPEGLPVVVRGTRSNELVVVASPDAAGNWAGATWLMREPGSGTRATTEALLDELSLDPPRLTLGSNSAVLAGVAAGLGVTLGSREEVQDRVERGELVVVDVPGTPLERPYFLVSHAEMTGPARRFVELALSGVSPERGFAAYRRERRDRRPRTERTERTAGP